MSFGSYVPRWGSSTKWKLFSATKEITCVDCVWSIVSWSTDVVLGGIQLVCLVDPVGFRE